MTRVTSTQIAKLGLLDCHELVPDFTAPKKEQINRLVEFITRSLAEDKPIGISCGMGLGRTGTILACYLVTQGYEAGAAIDGVRGKRPGSIETKSQEDAVKAYAEQF